MNIRRALLEFGTVRYCEGTALYLKCQPCGDVARSCANCVALAQNSTTCFGPWLECEEANERYCEYRGFQDVEIALGSVG